MTFKNIAQHARTLFLFLILTVTFNSACDRKTDSIGARDSDSKRKNARELQYPSGAVTSVTDTQTHSSSATTPLSFTNLYNNAEEFQRLLDALSRFTNSASFLSPVELSVLSLSGRTAYAKELHSYGTKAYNSGSVDELVRVYDYLANNGLLGLLDVRALTGISSQRASIAMNHDDYDTAERVLDKAVPVAQRTSDSVAQRILYSTFGDLRQAQGRFDEAREMFDRQAAASSGNAEVIQSARFQIAMLGKDPNVVKKSLWRFLQKADDRWDTYRIAIERLALIEAEPSVVSRKSLDI